MPPKKTKTVSPLTGMPAGISSYDPMSGTGVLDFMKKVGTAVSKTNDFLKNSKIISKSARAVAHVTGNKAISNFATQADAYGYGAVVPNLIVVKPKRKVAKTVKKKKAK